MDEDMKSRGQWFAVQTLSGQEKKARENIQRLIDMGEAAGIYEAVIPEERVSEVRNGKQFIRPRKLFPGYIFIRMDLYDPSTGIIDEDAWYFVRNVKGIIGFIGGTNNPTPLAESEVRAIFRTEEARETVVPKIVYEVGETVRICDGAFENFEGVVQEIDNERGKLKLMVSIFGRSTPVELEFWQVDREL